MPHFRVTFTSGQEEEIEADYFTNSGTWVIFGREDPELGPPTVFHQLKAATVRRVDRLEGSG